MLSHLSAGSVISMSVRVTGLALAFLSHLVLSHMLGASQYGIYVIALGWAMVLVIPARLGLDNSVLRYATIYREQGRAADLRGLVVFSCSTIAGISLLIVATLLLVKALGIGPLRPISMTLLIGMAMVIPLLALLGWVSALVRTAHRIFASQFYEQVLRPALLIATLGLLAAAGRAVNADLAMIVTGLTVGVATLGVMLHARSAYAGLAPARPSFEHRREWLSVSWILFLMAVVQELLNQVDVILLGLIGNAEQAGHFAAAWRLASLVPFGLVALATVSGPLIASAHARNDLGEMARIARLTARFGSLFGAMLALLLAALGQSALSLFGPGFDRAYPALLVLLAGGLVNSFTGIVGYMLVLTGHQRAALAILAGALLISFSLNLALIPMLGALGSAIASSAALVAWNLAMAATVRSKFGIDATALGRRPKRSPGSV
ncbi:MAG TPA: oligosaccharide flippase family protein [Sphingomicrobium sp.]|nr:oligosaccharide flippase family protein [Sphingomicrobium sp.]